VLIHRRVVEERRTIEVPVTREELIVEWVPAEQWPAASSQVGTDATIDSDLSERLRALRPGESIRVPLVEEEVVIDKRPVVVQEVTIGTRRVQGTQQVSGTARREQLRIDNREAAVEG
jgi:uncharacterized protein (TIGR02271 family)